jgi:hypothetical protein
MGVAHRYRISPFQGLCVYGLFFDSMGVASPMGVAHRYRISPFQGLCVRSFFDSMGVASDGRCPSLTYFAPSGLCVYVFFDPMGVAIAIVFRPFRAC